ncbi:MAG: bifunctional riboflavin kinase/FAD synthetase [Gammaproteobacteria bacterium]|nr:bifunctional riboflavin kinase/FAD synthetase [Gammaproteobacteria bacterium]
MQFIRGLHNLTSLHYGCVATIGNFDGVHLGHQAVLGQLAEKGAELGLPTVVITFEPQPQEYFSHGDVPPRLTRLREKVKALTRFSVDRVLCLSFNPRLAALSADEFVQQVLLDGLGVKYLVVGDDFHFGSNRSGNFETLKRAGEQHGFEVVNMHTFSIGGLRVSSTRVRQALQVGDLDLAEQLLGRPYRMSGRVAHGNKLGRTIGFPTANLFLHRKKTPVDGVYAVEMYGVEGEPVAGVANVGTRPTVGGTRSLLEVHLFNFNREIYRAHVNVDFLLKIREERKFESFDALKQQILKDGEQAENFFKTRAAESAAL